MYGAIRNGDESAFTLYYENTVDRLVNHTKTVTQDLEEAQNIAHDTFVKLWQQKESIENLDGFLFTTAINAALNVYKKKKVHAKYYSEQMFLQNGEELAADAAMLVKEIERQVEEVIRNMPPQRRKVFELSRNEGLSYNEIAERMNLSYNTVRNYMVLALDSIRSIITTCFIVFFHNLR